MKLFTSPPLKQPHWKCINFLEVIKKVNAKGEEGEKEKSCGAEIDAMHLDGGKQ
jgi:hypothetical protein